MEHSIELDNAGVRYRLITEDQRTLKGRILRGLSRRPAVEFWALKNVSLHVNRGEVLGVIGRNGSGKSTLLRVMSGVIEPTEGAVRTSGRVYPILELGAAFDFRLTGRENVYLNAALMRMDRTEVDRLLPEIIAFAELGMFFDLPLNTYSSGMAARLAFAVSTQITPEILVLDEVLAVGDEQFQRRCLLRIRKLIEQGSAVVLVSHQMDVIQQFCNRAVYMAAGQVVEDGTPATVVARYRADLPL